MNASELAEYLSKAIPAGMPVLVQGKPGVGKTAVCKQVAENLSMKALFSHPVTDEPVDYKGLPWIADGIAKFFPIGVISDVLNATEPTIWFIDDVGQAPLSVQAALMQWTHADSRCLNGQELPDCVTIVMMTNRKEDRAGVSGFLEPFKTRFSTIIELQADVQSFTKWAIAFGLDPMIMAFCQWKPELLSQFEPSSGLTVGPSPRGWHHLDNQLKLNINPDYELEVYSGCIGAPAAQEFLAFRRIYSRLPSLSMIETDPDRVEMPTENNVLFALTGALAKRANSDSFAPIAQYAQRMPDEFKVVFTEMMQQYNQEDKDYTEWPGYTDWGIHVSPLMV